jgi:hypothetical protein
MRTRNIQISRANTVYVDVSFATTVTAGIPNNPEFKIPIKVFDPPIESILHVPNKPKPIEVTTSWPDDVSREPSGRSGSSTSVTSIHESNE